MDATKIPAELLYSEDHEWYAPNGRVGVSDFAQNALGDLTYVELPAVGDRFEKGDEFGTLESTKSVSPLFMPISGTVKAVNEALSEAPELINRDPYGDGWIILLEECGPSDGLLDAEAYRAHLEAL